MRLRTLMFAFLLSLMLMSVQLVSAQNYYHMTQGTGFAIVPGTDDIGLHGDDDTLAIALPFSYSFYGSAYTSVAVGTNGNLQFTGNSNQTIIPGLPDLQFTNTIFAYQYDLFEGDAKGGQGIFTSVSGVAPNRVFNIEWRTTFCCNAGTPTENFEVRLYEGLEKFDIIYGEISTTGENTTVGVQKDNLEFTEYESHTAGTLQNSMKQTFSSFGPTAAAVSVSGAVLDPKGNGLQNAIVTLIGSGGIVAEVETSDFGYFKFKDVPSGEAYVLTVKSKRYRYDPRFIKVMEDITGMAITPALGFLKPIKGPVDPDPVLNIKAMPGILKLQK